MLSTNKMAILEIFIPYYNGFICTNFLVLPNYQLIIPTFCFILLPHIFDLLNCVIKIPDSFASYGYFIRNTYVPKQFFYIDISRKFIYLLYQFAALY